MCAMAVAAENNAKALESTSLKVVKRRILKELIRFRKTQGLTARRYEAQRNLRNSVSLAAVLQSVRENLDIKSSSQVFNVDATAIMFNKTREDNDSMIVTASTRSTDLDALRVVNEETDAALRKLAAASAASKPNPRPDYETKAFVRTHVVVFANAEKGYGPAFFFYARRGTPRKTKNKQPPAAQQQQQQPREGNDDDDDVEIEDEVQGEGKQGSSAQSNTQNVQFVRLPGVNSKGERDDQLDSYLVLGPGRALTSETFSMVMDKTLPWMRAMSANKPFVLLADGESAQLTAVTRLTSAAVAPAPAPAPATPAPAAGQEQEKQQQDGAAATLRGRVKKARTAAQAATKEQEQQPQQKNTDEKKQKGKGTRALAINDDDEEEEDANDDDVEEDLGEQKADEHDGDTDEEDRAALAAHAADSDNELTVEMADAGAAAGDDNSSSGGSTAKRLRDYLERCVAEELARGDLSEDANLLREAEKALEKQEPTRLQQQLLSCGAEFVKLPANTTAIV